LWLGLFTGIVVVIVSLTGAVLTFEEELRLLLQPYQKVQDQGKLFLPPSALAASARKAYNIAGVSAVIYRGRERSAVVPWYGDRKNFLVNYLNPYSGKPLFSQPLSSDFYRIMVEGHYQLWLPRKIGQPIVAYSTLIFAITLITGLVLWWPKRWTRSAKKQSFLIRTKASFKRLNYDLHNVIGFYALLIALILALTGMVFGMQWFSKAVYWTASGGKTLAFERSSSDTTITIKNTVPDEDLLFNWLLKANVDMINQTITFGYPYGKAGTWSVGVNPSMGKRSTERSSYFEQHTLKLLKAEPSFSQLNGGEKLMKLNYDLHAGAIGGIATKIIAFLVCLISASLPITGLIIWLGRKKRLSR